MWPSATEHVPLESIVGLVRTLYVDDNTVSNRRLLMSSHCLLRTDVELQA